MINKIKDYLKKEHPMLNLLSTYATIWGITIITVIEVLTSIWSTIPFVKINTEEENIEKIKVSQSYEYVESILGKPYMKNTYLFPTRNDGASIIGSKAIFSLQFCCVSSIA